MGQCVGHYIGTADIIHVDFRQAVGPASETRIGRAGMDRSVQAIKENALDINVGGTLKSIPVGKSFRDSLLNDINVMAR